MLDKLKQKGEGMLGQAAKMIGRPGLYIKYVQKKGASIPKAYIADLLRTKHGYLWFNLPGVEAKDRLLTANRTGSWQMLARAEWLAPEELEELVRQARGEPTLHALLIARYDLPWEAMRALLEQKIEKPREELAWTIVRAFVLCGAVGKKAGKRLIYFSLAESEHGRELKVRQELVRWVVNLPPKISNENIYGPQDNLYVPPLLSEGLEVLPQEERAAFVETLVHRSPETTWLMVVGRQEIGPDKFRQVPRTVFAPWLRQGARERRVKTLNWLVKLQGATVGQQ